ncbi:MAG: hypothetical protein FJ100_23315 [Deltaproteobacteria bacterium]|nr:hypothetical protein [Deltaproteobacteria bacterium]
MQGIQKLAESLKSALQAQLPGADIELDDGGDAAALTFEHPAHKAMCIAVLEPDPRAGGVALMAAVVILDVADIGSPQALLGLMTLNVQLMTCALGVLPINADELALVLCRRMPATAVEPADLAGLYNDMMWEWGQMAPSAEAILKAAPPQPQTPAPSVVAPPRPRIIGSLDDL